MAERKGHGSPRKVEESCKPVIRPSFQR
jgi:hypothetical protein